MIVSLTGEIDPVTGMVMDLKDLKDIIKKHIEDPLDHKNLNLDVEYFKSVMPSAENICIYIWEILRKQIDLDKKLEVVLFETPRNFVKFSG